MGYYTTLTGYDVRWKEGTDEGQVLQHVKETMFTDEALLKEASGGSWPIPQDKPVSTYKWYSWTDTEVCRNATDINTIITQFFDGNTINAGEWWPEFDSKKGDEDILMRTLAPFIAEDSYMEWRGEDGYLYRWEFDGDRMVEVTGTVVWE